MSLNSTIAARIALLEKLRREDPPGYLRELKETCHEVGYPGGTSALWDSLTDTFYNYSGQQLKRPENYKPDNDGRYH